MRSLIKNSIFMLLASVLLLSNPYIVSAEEITVDDATVEMISSIIQNKTSDGIVDKIIDDFNGDGNIEAIVATSPLDSDFGDYFDYALWYVSDGVASSLDFDTKESFMRLNLYTIAGQKLVSFAFFENHVTTSDYIYIIDKNGFHLLGIYPSMYQDGDYLISSQGYLGEEGWYFEEKTYTLKDNELVPVDELSNSASSEEKVQSTNPITNPNWYKDYNYQLDAESKTITLTNYYGLNEYLHVKNSAVIDGTTYSTCIDGKLFTENNSIKGISFAQGCKVSSSELSFRSCENLESINLYGLDTSEVVSMDSMFARCQKLQEVRLGNLNLSNVNNMSFFFTGCTGLKYLNLYDVEIPEDAYIFDFFSGCELNELVTPKNLNHDIIVPCFFVMDNNKDGVADSDEKYKIIPKGTEAARFISYSTFTNDYTDSGIEYECCSSCELKKIGEDYYLFPSYSPRHYFWDEREGISYENYENGIKIAKDAIVGIAVKENIIYGEEDAWGEYYYEYQPFYEIVDTLFENEHWTIDEYNSLNFEVENYHIIDYPRITINADGEICVISDYYCS